MAIDKAIAFYALGYEMLTDTTSEVAALNKYRQLVAESLGKEYNTSNKQVLVGITPTVSIGSIDLHSVGQLYLGGPYDKFTTFIMVGKLNRLHRDGRHRNN